MENSFLVACDRYGRMRPAVWARAIGTVELRLPNLVASSAQSLPGARRCQARPSCGAREKGWARMGTYASVSQRRTSWSRFSKEMDARTDALAEAVAWDMRSTALGRPNKTPQVKLKAGAPCKAPGIFQDSLPGGPGFSRSRERENSPSTSLPSQLDVAPGCRLRCRGFGKNWHGQVRI
jgi:hypothetical protein